MADPASSSTPSDTPPAFRRVLLKLSGESLCEPGGFGIAARELGLIAQEIARAAEVGAQIAIVVGGGNIIRGASLASEGAIAQATADQMGMLGTVMNGLALAEALERAGAPARVMSAVAIGSVVEPFSRLRAIEHLEAGRVVVFVAGTGNPFFTTDTAAALRAIEIGADALLKATKVDGVYDKDPARHADAKRYASLTFDQAVTQRLGVMDLAAFSLCMDHRMPILVFDMKAPGHIREVVAGASHGTWVRPDESAGA